MTSNIQDDSVDAGGNMPVQLPGHIKFKPPSQASVDSPDIDGDSPAQLPGHIKFKLPTGVGLKSSDGEGDSPEQLPGHIKFKLPTRSSIESVDAPTDASQRWWWDRTAPFLETLLAGSGGYTAAEQADHMGVLRDVVVPSLGPPTHEANVRALLTVDKSPFEPSWNFQTGSDDMIRYVFEPLGGIDAGTDADPFVSRDVAALARLVAAHTTRPADMGWFDQLCQRWFVGPDDPDEVALARAKLPVGATRAPQMYFAYDMKGAQRTLKTYHFPQLKSLAHGTSMTDLTLDAISALQPGGEQFAAQVERVREYLTKRARPGAHIELVGIDCAEPAAARVKVYVRSRDNSVAMVRDVMTLGGAQTDAVTMEAVALMEKVYPFLMNERDGVRDDQIKEAREPHPIHSGCVNALEMRAGASRIDVKTHIPIAQYSPSDETTAVNFADALRTLGWHDAADKFARTIAVLAKLPGKDFSKSGALSYASFLYNEKGPYMSCYMSAQPHGV